MLPATSVAWYVTVVIPWLRMLNEAKLPTTVAPPLCAPLRLYEIDCTPEPPESSCAFRLTNTLTLFQPFALGGVPNERLDVGGVTSFDRIETRPAVHPCGVQPVEFVTQSRASGSSAKTAGEPPMSSVSTSACYEPARIEIVVAMVLPT